MRPGEWPKDEDADLKVEAGTYAQKVESRVGTGEVGSGGAASDHIPEAELPDVPPESASMPSMEPGSGEQKDLYEWSCDPRTFVFDRLIFGEGVEDEAKVNDKLSVRLRTLTAKQRVEIDADLSLDELRARWVGTMNKHSLKILSHMIVSINGASVGDSAKEVEGYLEGRPDTYVSVLSSVANEFSTRIARLAERGDPKNC